MLKALAGGLGDAAIPPKIADKNLLIGTWNLRAFGGLTEKWASTPDDEPQRNFADLCAIAEVARALTSSRCRSAATTSR